LKSSSESKRNNRINETGNAKENNHNHTKVDEAKIERKLRDQINRK
jgi:hypothetical protein